MLLVFHILVGVPPISMCSVCPSVPGFSNNHYYFIKIYNFQKSLAIPSPSLSLTGIQFGHNPKIIKMSEILMTRQDMLSENIFWTRTVLIVGKVFLLIADWSDSLNM